MLGAVDEIQDSSEKFPYAKILVITQSSGMGKSKTVNAMANERILLPLCVREELDAESFGAMSRLPLVQAADIPKSSISST